MFHKLGEPHYCLNNLSKCKVLKDILFASEVKHSMCNVLFIRFAML